VLLDAVQAFVDVLRTDEVLQLNIRNVEALEQETEEARLRLKVREASSTDVNYSESRLASAQASMAQAVAASRVTKARYAIVFGHPPGQLEPIKIPLELPRTIEEVKANALASNPSVAVATWSAQSARKGVDLITGEMLPTLNLTASYDRAQNASDAVRNQRESSSSSTTIFLALNIPLYSGGGTESRIREQKQTYGRFTIEIEKAKRDIQEAAEKAWNDLMAARARIGSFTSEIASAEVSLKGVKLEASSGSRTKLEVLNAEMELFLARVNLSVARYDAITATFRVITAMGQMTAEGLGLPVDLYDPARNYDETRGRWFGTDTIPDK
jgi:outer membrane protein